MGVRADVRLEPIETTTSQSCSQSSFCSSTRLVCEHTRPRGQTIHVRFHTRRPSNERSSLRSALLALKNALRVERRCGRWPRAAEGVAKADASLIGRERGHLTSATKNGWTASSPKRPFDGALDPIRPSADPKSGRSTMSSSGFLRGRRSTRSVRSNNFDRREIHRRCGIDALAIRPGSLVQRRLTQDNDSRL
jgi:hypothetical protein